MQIVKVSQPREWENKINLSTPGEAGIWKGYKFILTSEKIECDYWVVLGDLDGTEEAICSEENVLYITDEAYTEKKYNEAFLKQFPAVATSREDIFHENIILTPYICGWFLKRNYDFLKSLQPGSIDKTKILSAVSSNLTALDGHKKRFAFINKMIGHFKERLDVFGRGFNEVDDKYNGLVNYQHSIAIENSHLPRYFSEKISDCFLSYTMPIYYGCSDITNYFPEEAMVLIDLDDYLGSIATIEEAISNNRFHKNFDYLVDARNLYFQNHHPLQAISRILDTHLAKQNKKRKVTLNNITSFKTDNSAKSELVKFYKNYIKRSV